MIPNGTLGCHPGMLVLIPGLYLFWRGYLGQQ